MLEEIGIQAIEDFFAGIPEDLRLRNQLKIPTALTEPELLDYFQRLSTRNSKTQKLKKIPHLGGWPVPY